MANREFVVQKVGDKYITVPVDRHPHATRTAFGVWGLVLAVMGMRSRGWAAFGLTACGALMTYRATTGRSPFPQGWLSGSACGRDRSGKPGQTPSYQNDASRAAGQTPSDEVDEASMESFPASDPPAKMSAAAQPK